MWCFGRFGDNLEYFSSTNSLFLTFSVLEIFVDNKYISVISPIHYKNFKQNPLVFKLRLKRQTEALPKVIFAVGGKKYLDISG